jgi:putative restriction endonuclease
MAKVVLTHKVDSIYDDLPEERYHFPQTYIRQIESAIGDLAVYYEPGRTGASGSGRTGRQSYIAVAKITRVERDPLRTDHYYAFIEPGSYLVFDRPVPFKDGDHYYERRLRRNDGETNRGAFGRAVRPLADVEFDEILGAGFARELTTQEKEWDFPELDPQQGFFEAPANFQRPVIEQVLTRPVRDAAFTRAVRDAYDSTCALSGLRLTNGRGRPEVQAAHIRPVRDCGPDSVRNGIALSATFHWMFDRGLISIGPPPGYEILITRKGLPDNIMQIFNPDRRLRMPASPSQQPAPVFLDYHRSTIFDKAF